MIFKKLILFVSITAFLFPQSVLAQNGLPEREIMDLYFKNFEYDKVISTADSILLNRTDLNEQQLLAVYKMRALSNYSLLQMNLALKDFIEILNINPEFSLDPVQTSPKIITFFNEIKANFQAREENPQVIETQRDTIRIVKDTSGLFKNMLIRSVIVPGSGHIYLDNSAKGWLLTSASSVTLAGAVYYIFDCNRKEKSYLNETNPALIEEKYNNYNSSYKKRNILITTYAVLWLYSQTDILFFQSKKLSPKVTISLKPFTGPLQTGGICCNIHF
ncbi:hypothetical protein JXQ31_17890 [candidate division KSB1 bacterium]|nr:hypothetical protein [candidate division KSB1 bacterium]